MRLPMFFLAAAAGLAHGEPIADRERAAAAQAQAEQQRRIEIARERCLANRGTDCDTVAGLQEWLPAVIDRIILMPGASASAGPSGPVRPDVPATSPRYP